MRFPRRPGASDPIHVMRRLVLRASTSIVALIASSIGVAQTSTVATSPGESPDDQRIIEQCTAKGVDDWVAAQHTPPTAAAKQAVSTIVRGICRQRQHPLDFGPHITGPIFNCEKGEISTTGDQHADDIPPACQSRVGPNGLPVNWLRVHLRGGYLGNLPDPMFGRIRPVDGHLVIYAAPASQLLSGLMPLDQLVKQHLSVYPQGKGPALLYAMLHKREGRYVPIPLNYSPKEPSRAEMPWGPADLYVTYDSVQDKYLLFADVRFFRTPPWDATIPSWEDFYVWRFDAKTDNLNRQLLPPGPWVDDAKFDGALRDVRNAPCGTDCYRHFELKLDAGNVFVSISGKESAINRRVLGTYRLSADGRRWEKIKDGIPDPS
jgi:hypothetical protein